MNRTMLHSKTAKRHFFSFTLTWITALFLQKDVTGAGLELHFFKRCDTHKKEKHLLCLMTESMSELL